MHSMFAARSSFSIGESILSVEGVVECATAVGAKIVALTDTMSITGMVDFTKRAEKAGVKPIIGCRLRLVDDIAWRKKDGGKRPAEYFVTAYVLSEQGMKAIYRLLSLAQDEDHFYNVPKLSFDDLFAALATLTADDLAIASDSAHSVVCHSDARNIMKKISASLSASNAFMQLTPIDTPYFDAINKRAIALSKDLGLPTLTVRPVLYKPDEFAAAEIMNAISANTRLDSIWHNSPAQTDMHARTLPELIKDCAAAATRLKSRLGLDGAGALFKQGLVNVGTLADRISYLWKKQSPSLPVMSLNEMNTVIAKCMAGWKLRFAQPVFGHQPSAEELRDVYRPRLAYELEVLKKLGFSNYFLLVEDVVSFAKSSGILVGPGRGSVGGSLVAYLLGITDCDPIRFGLLFERFINPDRIDLPDADLDFMSERRGEIIDYLIGKYGAERVAGVSNFGTLASASTIRDVSKAFGLSEDLYRCTKLMPKKHGVNVKLEEAAEQVSEIADFRDRFEPIWDVALKLEGCLRNMGRHAAGVVVGGEDIVNRAVIERRKDGATVNWDKRIVEDQGLIKMDILGLSTLDLIDLTLRYIRERHGKKVDLLRIPLDDKAVLDNFAKALTVGVFQFESGGMRKLLKELGRSGAISFDDITAATALYRPGPMESGMMDSYWKRKLGEEDVEYDHPLMIDILQPTFGVIVYQEQVMQISRVIAGYSAPDADKLRKIMGKKLPEEMKKERGKFVDGCVATIGCDADWAGDLFDKIEGFAGYGFNKSHSVEYTLISWQSMWLKTHFPVEFFAAALTLMDQDKLPALLKDVTRFGVEIDLPDINHSTDRFEILTDTRLMIPFNRVKQISSAAAGAIVAARKDGKGEFKSIADLSARVERRKCNVRHIEILNKIGAFARIEPGQLPAKHPDRVRDQRELIPGLIIDYVPIAREMHNDKDTKAHLLDLIDEYRAVASDECDGVAVKPAVGKRMSAMVIFDSPSPGDEKMGALARDPSSASWNCVCEAMGSTDKSVTNFYWTALIKRPKSGKQVSPEEIARYAPYLDREIELLKPPAIVLLGSAVVRRFFPDFKGKASDQAGKVIYDKNRDCNFVIGFNPGEIYYEPAKQTLLNEVFEVAAQLTE
jgi:DNA polymerase-3 subunit alpha